MNLSIFGSFRNYSTSIIQKDLTLHRSKLELLGKDLGYNSMEDWYQLKWTDIKNYDEITSIFNNSIPNMLKTIFNDHKWFSWKFLSETNKFDNQINRRQFFDWLINHL